MSAAKADAWLAGARTAVAGNTPWAARYAAEIRELVRWHAEHAPRNVQSYLGPSEIGSDCDRQVIGKMAGLPATNHVSDPWPSIVGTAVHAWLADAFTAENRRLAAPRWLAEQRVTPDPRHPGTADLYDAYYRLVDDHKVLGESSMNKLKSRGPSRRYKVQLGLYGIGYIRLGLPVDGVVLLAYPRTGSSLEAIYAWHEPLDTPFLQLLTEVLGDTDRRHALAAELAAGRIQFTDLTASPDDDECYFCPFYRPDALTSGVGCAGTKMETP